MTGSRVSRLCAGLVRLGVGLLAGASLVVLVPDRATAQIGAPIQIGPPPINPPTDAPGSALPAFPIEPPPAGQSVTPAFQVAPQPRTTSDGAITIDRLQRLTLDATGTLTPAIGGLRADYWNGTPGEIALRLVALMPAAPDSRALRDLGRRALLSAGPAPADLTPEGALLQGRAERLLAMGAIDDLGVLGDRIPGDRVSLGLSRPLAEAAFARSDDAWACGLYDRLTQTATDAFWIKVAMVCDARAGRQAKVDFGARLLSEIGEEDELMMALAQAAATGQTGVEFRMGGAGPVHLALARVAGLKIDPDIPAIQSLPVLVGIARGSASAPFAIRLEAAEKAERSGAIAPQEVTNLYSEVSVSIASVDAAIAAAEADPGPLSRAILWRVAEGQTVPVARAQAVAKAMEMAEDDGAWRQTVRLFSRFLVSLDPGPDLDWFAENAVRGLVAAGDIRAARPWIDRMRRLSASGSDDASLAWLRLWAAVRVAGGDEVTPYDEAAVARWWEHLRSIDPQQASLRGAAALALMAALGDPIGNDAWRGLVSEPSIDVSAVPGTAYAFAIRAAGESQRLGETVALCVAAPGETALGEIAVPALADIVRALVAVGLEPEARRFAAEAALAHGL
ncbi:MAG: hypothetical protein P1U88_09390 [Thalassobaculaceae bacterium]|nr:hypothetical protein [Thalassobaculaceae bacterium]